MIFSTSLLSTKLSTPNYPHTGVAQLLGRVLIDDRLAFSLFDCWNLFFLMCPCLAGVSVGRAAKLDLGDANLLSVDGTINVEGNGLLLGKVTTDQPCINVFPELTTVSGESDTIVYILRVVVKSGSLLVPCIGSFTHWHKYDILMAYTLDCSLSRRSLAASSTRPVA